MNSYLIFLISLVGLLAIAALIFFIQPTFIEKMIKKKETGEEGIQTEEEKEKQQKEEEEKGIQTQLSPMTKDESNNSSCSNCSNGKVDVSPMISEEPRSSSGVSSTASFISKQPDVYARDEQPCENVGYALDAQQLLPQSWRDNDRPCKVQQSKDVHNFAPTPQALEQYLVAGGSIRLGTNTRSPNSRIVGLPSLLRPMPPIPTGMYPKDSSC